MSELWSLNEGDEKTKDFILKPPEPEIVLDYPIDSRDYVKAGKASSEIKLFLKKLGINPEILRRVAIASYEAEINVTAHSQGGHVYANIYSDCILMIFTDEGPGIESIEKAMIPGYSTADDLAREMGFGAGMGLPNIKKNCDAMYIKSTLGDHTELYVLVRYKEVFDD
jgi:serine/threonine-protein kinase RsbT